MWLPSHSMFDDLAQPTYSACADCGAALHRDERPGHACDADRLAAAEAAPFEAELAAWLATPDGRFAAWRAANRR
jgi:hypothetical protein